MYEIECETDEAMRHSGPELSREQRIANAIDEMGLDRRRVALEYPDIAHHIDRWKCLLQEEIAVVPVEIIDNIPLQEPYPREPQRTVIDLVSTGDRL